MVLMPYKVSMHSSSTRDRNVMMWRASATSFIGYISSNDDVVYAYGIGDMIHLGPKHHTLTQYTDYLLQEIDKKALDLRLSQV